METFYLEPQYKTIKSLFLTAFIVVDPKTAILVSS